MLRATRWRWAGLLIGAALWCGSDGGANAQEKKAFDKHDASALNAALRDVINAGAKLYNDNGDHAGCFRMYEGALISVRPFVAPDLQKKIDASLSKCDQLGSYADRAFELRRILDEIRERTKGPGETVGPPPTLEPESKEKGTVAGTLMFDGKKVAGGYLVKLFSAGGKEFSTGIAKDGAFQFKTPIPVGEYRIAIVPIDVEAKAPALPLRYASEAKSGLVIRVQPGKQSVDLHLVK